MLLAPESYDTAALILIVLGLSVAVLSGLEPRVKWVQRFCAFFGEGCSRTAEFTLFRVPIPWWGIAYYLALGFVFYLVRPWMFWAVMAGFGIECTFVTIMAAIRALCVFCVLNSVIVALLAVFSFDVQRIWQAALAALFAYAGSLFFITRENGLKLKKPPKDEVLSEIEEEAEEGMNPALGPEDAPVSVIEFSDYLCPFCRKARPVVDRIRKEYEGRIRWVYMDFPLDMHEGAKDLARAPRCAGDQGKFWEYQDLLLEMHGRPTPRDLENYAGQLGLALDRFRACLSGTRHAGEVEQDIAEGVKAGVSATPTFLVNGKALVAPSYEELRGAIDKALAAIGRVAGTADAAGKPERI